MLAVLFFTLALFADPSAPAIDASQQPAAATAAVTETVSVDKKAKRERIQCRMDAKANSRLGRKICKTTSEWAEQEATAQQALQDIQNRTQTQMCPPTGCV